MTLASEILTEDVTVTRGVARDIEIHLFDQDDQDEDLSGASLAVVTLRIDKLDLSPITKKQSLAEVTISDNKLIFSLDAADTTSLTRDTYIGQASVSIGGDTFVSDPFYVRVRDKLVEDA